MNPDDGSGPERPPGKDAEGAQPAQAGEPRRRRRGRRGGRRHRRRSTPAPEAERLDAAAAEPLGEPGSTRERREDSAGIQPSPVEAPPPGEDRAGAQHAPRAGTQIAEPAEPTPAAGPVRPRRRRRRRRRRVAGESVTEDTPSREAPPAEADEPAALVGEPIVAVEAAPRGTEPVEALPADGAGPAGPLVGERLEPGAEAPGTARRRRRRRRRRPEAKEVVDVETSAAASREGRETPARAPSRTQAKEPVETEAAEIASPAAGTPYAQQIEEEPVRPQAKRIRRKKKEARHRRLASPRRWSFGPAHWGPGATLSAEEVIHPPPGRRRRKK